MTCLSFGVLNACSGCHVRLRLSVLALLLGMSVGWAAQPQQASGPKVLFDRSTSIGGYVVPLTRAATKEDSVPAFYRVFIETLLGTLEIVGPTIDFSFGETVDPIYPGKPLPVYAKRFYYDTHTRIDKAIETIQPTDTVAIVTDLFQNDNDVVALVRSLRTNVLDRGMALAVIGVPTAYAGAVDPADLGAPRGQLIPYTGSLPIFCLVAGTGRQVKTIRDEFVARFRSADPEGKLLRTLIFDPHPAAPRSEAAMTLELNARGHLRNTAHLFKKDTTDPQSTLYVMAVDEQLVAKQPPGDFSVSASLPDVDFPFGIAAGDVTWNIGWERLDETQGRFQPDEAAVANRQETSIGTFDPGGHLLRANLRLRTDTLERGVIYRMTVSAALQPRRQELPAQWAGIVLTGIDLERARRQTDQAGLHEALAGRTPNLDVLLRDLAVIVSSQQGALPLGTVRLYVRRS
jgi:hypothetical protein